MDKDELIKRTKLFAHRCVKLAFALPSSILGNHIKSQLIRCSTSVAANYRALCWKRQMNHVFGWNLLLMKHC